MQGYELAQKLVRFPALTVMVILRRDIGFRMLNPFVLFATCIVLTVLASLASQGNPSARPNDLLIFLGLVFLNGLAQFIRRWWQLTHGGLLQHSYYIGSSPFAFKWLPNFIRENRRAARFLDPIFCAAIGFLLLPYSHTLAAYLIFAGLCLRAYEYTVWSKEQHRDLDMIDSLIVSGHQTQVVEQAASSPPIQSKPQSGVPTGLGADIQTKLKIPKSNDPSLN
jgi:hypothetical protein